MGDTIGDPPARFSPIRKRAGTVLTFNFNCLFLKIKKEGANVAPSS